jgi:hypothetical protein
MRMLPLAFAATLFCAGTATANGLDACDFESDFDLRLEPNGLSFHRKAGTPADVQMRNGELIVDGRSVALSAADRARVKQIEDNVRALVPEVKAIALDAVGIATEAVVQVASTLGGDNSEEAVERMHELGAELRDKIERSDDSGDWNEAEFERTVAALTVELVPMMVGNVTSIAIQAALTGDEGAAEALERRVEKMEKELEARVERRADDLDERAEALCPRLVELDALESALEVRLADNRPLDLLQIDD